MIEINDSGSFKNTLAYLERLKRGDMYRDLERYAQMGTNALSSATPRDTGETANSWSHKITRKGDSVTIAWLNRNENAGANIAILLQYGHGTGTGGYVEGQDYINPAMKPIFDQIAEGVWRRMTNG